MVWLLNLMLSLLHNMWATQIVHNPPFQHREIWQEGPRFTNTALPLQVQAGCTPNSASLQRKEKTEKPLTSRMYSSSTPRLWACFNTADACAICFVCDWVSLRRAKLLIFLNSVSVRIMWDSRPWKYSWKDSRKKKKDQSVPVRLKSP